jgi:hypothetical protein
MVLNKIYFYYNILLKYIVGKKTQRYFNFYQITGENGGHDTLQTPSAL